MQISSLTSDWQFLSNLEDIQLASAVDYAQVEITISGKKVFDEQIWAEASGKIMLYDVSSLLKPYLSAGVSSVTVKVTPKNSSAVTYSLSVVYCTAKMLSTPASGKTNQALLQSNWLTSTLNRDICLDAPAYVYYKNASQTISLDAMVLKDGVLTVASGITLTSSAESGYNKIDVSPNTVWLAAATKLNIDAIRVKLISYNVILKASGCTPSVCRFNVVDLGVSDVVVRFKNQYGLTEAVLLRGAADVEHEITLDTAYMGGMMKRINTLFQKNNSFNVPLATDDDLALLEQIVGSESIDVYDPQVAAWHECIITAADPAESTNGSAENAYTITYRQTGKDHRTTRMMSGSTMDGVFDRQHDTTFE